MTSCSIIILIQCKQVLKPYYWISLSIIIFIIIIIIIILYVNLFRVLSVAMGCNSSEMLRWPVGVVDFLVRGLMKKHEDHVRVLEALIYNQETLVNLKDAKIEELEDSKQQLQYHFTKLQDNQLFFDVRLPLAF